MEDLKEKLAEHLDYERNRSVHGKNVADALRGLHGLPAMLAVLGAVSQAVFSAITHPVDYWALWLILGALWGNIAKESAESSPVTWTMLPAFACLTMFLYRNVYQQWGSVSLMPGKCPFRIGLAVYWGLPMMLLGALAFLVSLLKTVP